MTPSLSIPQMYTRSAAVKLQSQLRPSDLATLCTSRHREKGGQLMLINAIIKKEILNIMIKPPFLKENLKYTVKNKMSMTEVHYVKISCRSDVKRLS